MARLNADLIVTDGKLSPKLGDNKITSTPKSSREGGHSTLNRCDFVIGKCIFLHLLICTLDCFTNQFRNGLKVEPTSGIIDVDASFIRNSETNPANGHAEEVYYVLIL